MTTDSTKNRIDHAARVIAAAPDAIFWAYMDPEELVQWLPPRGMRARIDKFEPREGGAYRITLTFEHPAHSTPGKTSEHTDVVRGRFLELIPDERIVQTAEFESADPRFAGEMQMTWTMTVVPGGTAVAIFCENVPEGIRPEDHEAGLTSTLDNLAAFVE